MMRMEARRAVWITANRRPLMEIPNVRKRSSTSEWSGSWKVTADASPNTLAASLKLTPCFARFARAFFSSQSKSTSNYGTALRTDGQRWQWGGAEECSDAVRYPRLPASLRVRRLPHRNSRCRVLVLEPVATSRRPRVNHELGQSWRPASVTPNASAAASYTCRATAPSGCAARCRRIGSMNLSYVGTAIQSS